VLGAVGLSTSAEAVYLAMLAAPQLDVAQLAAHLNEPIETVRSALDELIDLALVSAAGDGAGLRTVDPSIGMASLIARAEADVAEKQRQLEATRTAVMSLAAAHHDARDREQVTKWAGVAAVRGRLEELTARTTVECVSLNPRAVQTPDAKSASRPLNQQMLDRGVAIRAVYPDSHRFDPTLLDYATWLRDAGGEIRTAPTVPMLLIVYDRRIAILPIDPVDHRIGAQEIHSPGIVAATYGLFEQVWTGATPAGQIADLSDTGLDPQLRELARLLAAGHTDDMAARKLGLSLRTIKRKSAELLERLNARSRFQAGVLAAQRGWIEPTGRRAQRADAALAPTQRRDRG
jgi:DNA-binding CsgD family transcriptional regulator